MNELATEIITCDVAVSGAGPAGAMAALTAIKLGLEVFVWDKAIFPRDKICGDALSGKVVEVLKKYDPSLLEELRMSHIQVGSWGLGFYSPDGNCLKVPFRLNYNTADEPPGFLATRMDFDNLLANRLRKIAGSCFVENVESVGVEQEKEYIQIRLSNGNLVKAKTLIVADGAHSTLAKSLGGMKMEPAYHSAGLRVYYEGVLDTDPEHYIELHFLKDTLPGYFWIFPLPNGICNVGLGIRSDVVSKKKINLKKSLNDIIENHPVFKERFKAAKAISPVQGFGLPLGSIKRPISGNRFLLTGDAASLIDPFTGEGIGNAMISGWLAAKHLAEAKKSNQFDGSFHKAYDAAVYQKLGSELRLSYNLQRMLDYPFLFNMVVRKANNNKMLRETISCMFEDIDVRKRLRNPMFYFNLLFS